VPKAIDGLDGDTVMDTSAAAPTVSVVPPLIEPEVAVIVVAPVTSELASPCVPDELLIVAIAGSDELHVTDGVMS